MKNYWNVKLSSVFALLFLLYSTIVRAQFSEPGVTSLKEEKYVYPINPGQPGSLAGNLGELRTTHFHSGIDIRTDNKPGYAVHASKSGYISRASMSASGYGNALYITHPDGNTTLYAHLEKFKGPVGNYIRDEQYNKKTFEIDLNFPENKFPVRQGDTIALSGNTGSSGGPHLHFDIRDSENHALDPLQFGFSELVDKLPPTTEKIALTTLDTESRINDRFGRFEFYAYRSGSNYFLPNPILACGTIGVEILAKDHFSPGNRFFGGVKFIDMHVDSLLVFSQAIDRVNVSESRNIYSLINFKTLRTRGTRFYKLYIDDGNTLPYYKQLPSAGKVHVATDHPSSVQITLRDAHGNTSAMTFRLKPSPAVQYVKALEPLNTYFTTDITENILTINAKLRQASDGKGLIYINGKAQPINPNYFDAYQAAYLLDLRNGIPDSVMVCGVTVIPAIKANIPPSQEYKFYGDWADIDFPSSALYDTLYLNMSYARSAKPGEEELFIIGQSTFPLSSSITVSLVPKFQYVKNKGIGIYKKNNSGSYAYMGGTWLNGRINFTTRELGEFTILTDSVAPVIRPIYVNYSGARFKIKDGLSGISSYEATLNGQWLLMHYDSKSATLWSETHEQSKPLQGDFELVVTDNAGNRQVYSKKLPYYEASTR